MKKIISKWWGRLLCGRPRAEGNYSRYWGVCDEDNKIYENDIFQIGAVRSIIVDFLDKKGQWASHPMKEFIERMESIKRKK